MLLRCYFLTFKLFCRKDKKYFRKRQIINLKIKKTSTNKDFYSRNHGDPESWGQNQLSKVSFMFHKEIEHDSYIWDFRPFTCGNRK